MFDMLPNRSYWPMWGLIFLAFAKPSMAFSQEPENPYATTIEPILVKYCVACHNPSDHESNLQLHSLQSILTGGDAGPAMIPGKPDDSLIVRRTLGIDSPKMPPEDSPQPSPQDIDKLKQWILAGAPGTDRPNSLLDRWKQITKSTTHPTTIKTKPAITACAIIDSNHVLIGKFANVELLDLKNPTAQPKSIHSMTGKVSQIRVDSNAKFAAIAGGIPGIGGLVQIIPIPSTPTTSLQDSQIKSIEAHKDILYCAAIHPTHPWVATAGYDRIIRLWDFQSSKLLRSFEGHNGAVYDLDFDPSGQVLASASADETIKVWHVESGLRLDTLGQGEAEQLRVRFLKSNPQTPDQIDIIATGADRRIRQWRLPSLNQPSVSPMLESIFAHESTIHQLALSPDHSYAITAAHDGTIKLWQTQDWSPIADLPASKDLLTSIAWSSDASTLYCTSIAGELKSHNIAQLISNHKKDQSAPTTQSARSTWSAPTDTMTSIPVVAESNSGPRRIDQAQVLSIPVKLQGVLKNEDVSLDRDSIGGDWYAIDCKKGQALSIEIFASRDKSPLDSLLEITDEKARPVLRTRLQAVRESYFTFRGKDSSTIDDFRLHRWEDMELNQWLYAGGEVVQLWLYPRGPDSGFKVYPGFGNRFTYFGTSPIAHALNEPAWIVQEIDPQSPPVSNGLPVFPIYYSNDDDPQRFGGKDSKIDFLPPDNGRYYIRLRDTRGLSGDDFKYSLVIQYPMPRMNFKLETNEVTLRPDVGAEFVVSAERFDGLDGDIQVEFDQLPTGIQIASPLFIEKGQRKAIGQIRSKTPLAEIPKEFEITLIAKSRIADQEVVASNRPKLKLKVNDKPTMLLKLVDKNDPDDAPPIETLKIKPGQTISAKLVIQRGDLAGDIAFGGDDCGRNLPHGCFVDNIGLNGLLIPAGQSSREVFITAAPIVQPQRRLFHLRGNVDGNPTSLPVELIVQ